MVKTAILDEKSDIERETVFKNYRKLLKIEIDFIYFLKINFILHNFVNS